MSKEIIATKNAPGAIGPYSQGNKVGNLVFTSGQIPLDPATGKLVDDDIKKAAVQVLDNLKAILEEGGSSLEKVVKTVVYLKDINDFAAVNEVYATYFTSNYPARSCFQVGKLPMDAKLEIEAIGVV
ncbi:RidA family protein [Clostridium sp.]|jgi:2-iminobutanoate/2-iminopropanoate deaminase|uniref:RidA family protein n=1 Tax=Clostridium sp. TaxID=1506 RepID=UPI002583A5F6|nr:RidA family protein [Clostridium sp.]MDF2504175.1 putative endoribonuclease [Clostridium sp.]